METENNKDQRKLFKSLAAFQQECPPILKETKGYGYNYASLPEILEKINPYMKKFKLGFYQSVQDSSIKTVVFHVETGEQIESSAKLIDNVVLKGMNAFQVLGAQITYYRRYTLSALLGIVTEEDTDAQGEQVKKELPVLYRTTKDGKELTKYRNIVESAKEKGLKPEDLKKYYRISKEVFEHLKSEL
jgi:hypothetical protein